MNILITNQTTDPNGTSFVEATCGKTSAFVSTYKTESSVTVCCQNASHRVHRMGGRTFESFDQAIETYRSGEMKSIIRAARDIIAPQPENVIQFA